MKPYERTRRILHSAHTGPHKLALIAIADHLSADDAWAWPSVETVAQLSGQSTRTVQRSIKALVLSGALVEDVRRGRSTRYRISWDNLATPDIESPLTESHPRQDDTPDTESPAPDKMTGAPDTESPEVDKEADQGSRPSSSRQLALTAAGPDEWEQLRDHLVSLGRTRAAGFLRGKGNGQQLAKLLKRFGLVDSKRLLTVAYTSADGPHPFNRERGKGHPPLDTLWRHGAKYLEEADEVSAQAAGMPTWDEVCRWYDNGQDRSSAVWELLRGQWDTWRPRLHPMTRHRYREQWAA